MVEYVKDFIEANIALIEGRQWDAIWTMWYHCGNDYYLEDLIHVLYVANVQTEAESKEVRAKVLTREISAIVDMLLRVGRTRFTLRDIQLRLSSYLDFTDAELESLIDPVAKSRGMNKTELGWRLL